MKYSDEPTGCDFCHTEEFEIVLNESYGFVALCTECGYGRGATLAHLLAS
jgi:hypothetical protein